MPKIQVPAPNEKQRRFLRDEHKYLGYGGARGGGKSWALRVAAILLCTEYPGITVTIIRSTYPELRKNHIAPLTEMLQCYHPDRTQRFASYNDQQKTITFRNGSQIQFQFCANVADSMKIKGTETDVLMIDEATHITEEMWDNVRACVRGVNGFPKLYRLTFNPGGPGHEWVKRLFIDRAFQEGEDPEEYAFIQAFVQDNKALMQADPGYVRILQSLPEKLKRAWLYGEWDSYEGMFFAEFRKTPDKDAIAAAGITEEEARKQGRWTHVIPPVDLSTGPARGWRITRSYDFGYAKPFSCAWYAMDYDGTMYRILELYGCTGEPNVGVKWSPDQQFEEIARIEREHPWLKGKRIDGVADPSIWDASRGLSIADTAAKYGVFFLPGDNERIAGWMQCHYRLQFDEQGYARFYVFEGCEAFLRTIPALQYSRTKVEDLDTSMEDHAADEWRYYCMTDPVPPIRPVETKTIFSDPLNQYTKRR